MERPKILFSIPTRHHVEIALDELEGVRELGFVCEGFDYAAKEGVVSKAGRMSVIFQNAMGLVRIARRFKPDVIYFNSRLEKLAGVRDMITIAICRTFYKGKVKFVIKSHGSDIEVLEQTQGVWGKVIMPYLKSQISGWLFLSAEEQSKVIATGYLPAKNIFVAKNIVRNDQFEPLSNFKSKHHIPVDHVTLLFVGRTIEEKGVFEVMQAFGRIAKERADITLIIVGDGSSMPALKQLCGELQLDGRVVFTGFIPEQDVVAYYANCDILVFPTYFPEGFPMGLFNSVAAGMGIVTTPTRAATDHLTEPENCLWVQPKDLDSVYNAVSTLLQRPELLADMRQHNKAKGLAFSKEKVSAELAVTLRTIIDQQ